MAKTIVFSMNCQGLADYHKRKDVLNYIRSHKYQIICLQDIHVDKNMSSLMLNEWGFGGIIAPFTTVARGVAILFNNNLDYKILNSEIDPNGNFIILKLETENESFTLVNLYGPNKDSPKFYREIFAKVDLEYPTILCGDWNLVLEPKTDTKNYLHVNNPNARNVVTQTMIENDLCDPWRIQHPDMIGFTWKKKNPLKQARLDFFLATEDMMSHVIESSIMPGYRTDHNAVTLSLQFSKYKKGSGYWKFNNSFLRSTDFTDSIRKTIQEIQEQYAATPYDRQNLLSIPKGEIHLMIKDQLFLEVLLMEIRQKCIKHGAKEKRERQAKEKELEKQIAELEKYIASSLSNDVEENIEKVDKLKQSLQDHRENIMNGVIIRSRAIWYSQGEKPTRYFCNLEKRNYINKIIREIEVEGKIVNNPAEILDEQRKFYENLYSYRPTNEILANEIIDDMGARQLTENEANTLEGIITYEELSKTVKEMATNKSPGLDGYTAEFFKFFWQDLGIVLLRAINEAYTEGEFSVTLKRGLITCIPKPNKDRRFLKNWRPITLLPVIYKMASGCIANRLKTVLSDIITEEQTGFIKERYLGDNIRLLYDIIFETNKVNIPGLVISIDFEKAFDSISINFVQKSLAAFGFGHSIQNWVKLLYKNMSAYVIQDGHISKNFSIKRGCRQGDPIAPYFFLISL